jgi:phosphate acetyltransferase
MRGIGVRAGVTKVSSFMLMVTRRADLGEGGVLVFADCGVNPDPTAAELAEIAMLHGGERAAFLPPAARRLLSFSTSGSADHPRSRKVAEAARIVRRAPRARGRTASCRPTPRSFPRWRRARRREAPAGRANVLVFPTSTRATSATSWWRGSAGAARVGPILQGLERPANDLSRGLLGARTSST